MQGTTWVAVMYLLLASHAFPVSSRRLILCASAPWQLTYYWGAVVPFTPQGRKLAKQRRWLTRAVHLPGSLATMVPAPVETGGAVDGYGPRPRKAPTSIWVMPATPMALRTFLVSQSDHTSV